MSRLFYDSLKKWTKDFYSSPEQTESRSRRREARSRRRRKEAEATSAGLRRLARQADAYADSAQAAGAGRMPDVARYRAQAQEYRDRAAALDAQDIEETP